MKLFNFLKGKQPDELEIIEKSEPKVIKTIFSSNGKVTVAEIHKAFYTEVDRLLESCKIKPSKESINQDIIEKQNRLKKLGFNNTSISSKASKAKRDLQDIDDEIETKDSTIEAINYFKFKYPQYKFITEESVKLLCEKYGLVYGPSKNYIGDVPDKNIRDIENFKIKDDDISYCYTKTNLQYSWSNDKVDFSSLNNILEKIKENKNIYHYEYNKEQFTIVAPLSDFSTVGMQLTDNQLKAIPVVDDDPIVLQPVIFKDKKHFLIVTAWGEEASDPLVINENHN